MLQRQNFRYILLVSDLTACIISLVIGTSHSWGQKGPFFIVLGSFLIASWAMNALVLIYAAVRLRNARKNAPVYLPINMDLSDQTQSDQPEMGRRVFLLIMFGDVFFTVFLIIFTTLAFSTGYIMADGIAALGGIVSIVIHLYYVLSPVDYVLKRYRLQISFIRVDADEDHQIISKESSEAPSLQEPEVITPRPYRGSPSTKPSNGADRPEITENPITLIEPTEADSLIADHD